MQQSLPADNEQFRQYVRRWLLVHYPKFKKKWGQSTALTHIGFRRAWEDYLCAHGWSALGWPKQYGGQDLNIMQQAIFLQELAQAQTPLGVNLIGHGIIAPTLIRFGTTEQKQRFLPGIKNNSEIWCQGYSEPTAGSDLASVRTRAIKQAGQYIINGHKIWTSFADMAQWCFLLARTESGSTRHRGLSIFLVDMQQPGIRVEPIRQLTGQAEFCEVFFEDAIALPEHLLGQENDGWKIAMAAASFERGTYFIPRLIKFDQELHQLKRLITQKLQEEAVDSLSRLTMQQQWAKLAIDSHVLKLKSQRALQEVVDGQPPGPEGSATKVHWSEAHQEMLEFALTIVHDSPNQIAEQIELEYNYLWSKAETILAGTSEIQRNIIAERLLGLPRA
ncbi:MAG TPA: acyl-CoA dehydrogenase family protein [Paenalcaligenes sp.]|nr:acyl-CoA dehydrogenase family protein [Paenalcaligenes sp.]